MTYELTRAYAGRIAAGAKLAGIEIDPVRLALAVFRIEPRKKPSGVCALPQTFTRIRTNSPLADKLHEREPRIKRCRFCNGLNLLNRHHLFPKQITYQRKGMGKGFGPTVWTCRECHTEIHRRFTNAELYDALNEVGKLKRALNRIRNFA